MTAQELKTILKNIDWASLPDNELSSYRATLSVYEAITSKLLYQRKYAKNRFPKNDEE